MIEMRLEFFKRNRVILDRHPFGNDILAVPLFETASEQKILGRGAPQLAVPVYAGAADAVAEDKRSVASIWNGDIVGVMSNSNGLFRERLPQLTTDGMFEFIDDPRIFEIRRCVACRPSFQRDDGKTGVCQRFGHDGAGPAVTDDDRIDRSCSLCHQRLVPWMATGPSG